MDRFAQEFETIVEKVVEKRVAVPGPIKFVEKIVEVERVVEVEVPIEKIVEVPVPYPVEKVVEKIVPVPRYVEKVVKVAPGPFFAAAPIPVSVALLHSDIDLVHPALNACCTALCAHRSTRLGIALFPTKVRVERPFCIEAFKCRDPSPNSKWRPLSWGIDL